MIFLLLGCVHFHSIGKLKDFSSQEERVAHATQAARWSSKSFLINKAQKQAFSAQVVGQLRVASSAIVSQMIETAQSPSSSVRKQAYWTLGELGRELDWNEDSQAIHEFLLQQLRKQASDIESHIIIEAIIKNYVQHSHSIEEDVHTLKQLHSFLSAHPNPPSPIFVLKQQLQTLPVLIEVLREHHQEGHDLEVYTSSLELMRFLYSNQTQLYNAHLQYKQPLSEAFSLTVSILKQPSSSQSMILWFLSNVANRPPISSYLVEELVLLEEKLSPANQFLLQEALFQMMEEEASRKYFRETFLQKDTDFSWWQEAYKTDLDLVQQLYGIKVRSE